MNPSDIQFNFSQVGINWKSDQEDSTNNQITLKGTFENNGKTYEVTLTYSKIALQSKLAAAKLGDINERIKNSLNDVETETLAKLSGHTIRTNYEDLQEKQIHVLSGNQEIDWKSSNIANEVVRIQNVFQSVFGIKPLSEEMDEEEKLRKTLNDEIQIEFTESTTPPRAPIVDQDHLQKVRKEIKQGLKKPALDWKQILRVTRENIENIENGHVFQFNKDYSRAGLRLTIEDKRGKFQGRSQIPKRYSVEQHFDFHVKGIANLIDPKKEKNWLHLLEFNISQAAFAPMCVFQPKINNSTMVVNGEEKPLRTHNLDNEVKAEVVRDKTGKIEKLNLNLTMYTSIHCGEGENHDKVYLGYVKSTMAFALSFEKDGKTPKTRPSSCKHEFFEQPFTPPPQAPPGFFSKA